MKRVYVVLGESPDDVYTEVFSSFNKAQKYIYDAIDFFSNGEYVVTGLEDEHQNIIGCSIFKDGEDYLKYTIIEKILQ